MSITRILALDPGLKYIGWAVVESDTTLEQQFKLLSSGKFKHESLETKVISTINGLIKKFEPNMLAYEKSGSFLNKIYANIVQQATQKFGLPAAGFRVTDIRQRLYNDADISKKETNQILKDRIENLRKNVSKDELDAISVALTALKIPILK